jgi:hypothetical protein
MNSDTVDISIDWPDMTVSLGMLEMTYNLDDVLEIDFDGDCKVLEVTEYGLVLEYGDGETEFIDMRPVSTDLEQFEE